MAIEVQGPVATYVTGEAVVGYRRVKLNSSRQVVYADAGEDWIGVTVEAAASGNNVGVRLKNGPGTFKMMAAGAFSILDTLYAAADGKVDDNPAGALIGRALQASGADGDVVEVFPDLSLSQGGGDSVEVIGGSGGIVALNLVYVSDQTDNIMTVLKAQGTSGGRFADYICPNAIAADAKGLALKKYLLSGINTSAGSVGDPVYLDDSAAGAYTLTKPTATDKVQIVGRIVEDHATTGAILFDLSGPQQVVHDHSSNAEGGAELGTHKIKDGSDITFSETTGSNIGSASTQKFAFWGAAAVAQPTHNVDPTACAAMTQDTLTDSTGGSADTTLSAITGGGADAPSNASAAELNNNFADIAAQLAKIKVDLAACVTAIAANNAAIDAINADFATLGLTAST